jgi:hypothetical protein
MRARIIPHTYIHARAHTQTHSFSDYFTVLHYLDGHCDRLWIHPMEMAVEWLGESLDWMDSIPNELVFGI